MSEEVSLVFFRVFFSAVKINFVVAEVTFKEVVITSYSQGDLDHFFNGWQFVIAAEITGCDHFFCGQDHSVWA